MSNLSHFLNPGKKYPFVSRIRLALSFSNEKNVIEMIYAMPAILNACPNAVANLRIKSSDPDVITALLNESWVESERVQWIFLDDESTWWNDSVNNNPAYIDFVTRFGAKIRRLCLPGAHLSNKVLPFVSAHCPFLYCAPFRVSILELPTYWPYLQRFQEVESFHYFYPIERSSFTVRSVGVPDPAISLVEIIQQLPNINQISIDMFMETDVENILEIFQCLSNLKSLSATFGWFYWNKCDEFYLKRGGVYNPSISLHFSSPVFRNTFSLCILKSFLRTLSTSFSVPPIKQISLVYMDEAELDEDADNSWLSDLIVAVFEILDNVECFRELEELCFHYLLQTEELGDLLASFPHALARFKRLSVYSDNNCSFLSGCFPNVKCLRYETRYDLSCVLDALRDTVPACEELYVKLRNDDFDPSPLDKIFEFVFVLVELDKVWQIIQLELNVAGAGFYFDEMVEIFTDAIKEGTLLVKKLVIRSVMPGTIYQTEWVYGYGHVIANENVDRVTSNLVFA